MKQVLEGLGHYTFLLGNRAGFGAFYGRGRVYHALALRLSGD